MLDIGLAGAFFGGVASLLSPCSVMMVPAFFSYAFASPGKIVARTGVFFAGIVALLAPVGAAASLISGALFRDQLTLVRVISVLVIIAGIALILGFRLPGPTVTAHGVSALSTFLLGAGYAVAGTCAGPLLGAVVLVASLGSPLYGAAVMVSYGAGMALPLLVLALIWERLGTQQWLKPHPFEVVIGPWTWRNTRGMVIAGVLTVALGCLLFASGGVFSGLLDVSTQSRIEGWIVATFSRSWDVWVIPVALLAIALFVLVRNLESS